VSVGQSAVAVGHECANDRRGDGRVVTRGGESAASTTVNSLRSAGLAGWRGGSQRGSRGSAAGSPARSEGRRDSASASSAPPPCVRSKWCHRALAV